MQNGARTSRIPTQFVHIAQARRCTRANLFIHTRHSRIFPPHACMHAQLGKKLPSLNRPSKLPRRPFPRGAARAHPERKPSSAQSRSVSPIVSFLAGGRALVSHASGSPRRIRAPARWRLNGRLLRDINSGGSAPPRERTSAERARAPQEPR